MTFDLFFEQLGDFDWLGIIAGTIAIMVFGAIWYTPLFGKMFAEAHDMPVETGTPDPMKLGMHAVAMFVYNIGIAYFLADGFEHAVVAGGIIIGLLLVSSSSFAGVIWTKYPRKAWVIDAGHAIVGTALAMWVQSLFI